jgi:hypothetical protein
MFLFEKKRFWTRPQVMENNQNKFYFKEAGERSSHVSYGAEG